MEPPRGCCAEIQQLPDFLPVGDNVCINVAHLQPAHRDSGAWKGNSFNKGHACIHGKGFRGTPLLHTLTKISNAHSTAKLLGHVLPAGPIAHCGSQRLKWSWGAAAGKDCRKSPYERH